MSTVSEIVWHEIGSLSDIPIRGARTLKIRGEKVAVFRTQEDEVFAISDKCPHQGGPLSEGIVHGDCVTCPLHNWVISLRDGSAQGADSGQTKRFSVRLDQHRVLLGIEDDSE